MNKKIAYIFFFIMSFNVSTAISDYSISENEKDEVGCDCSNKIKDKLGIIMLLDFGIVTFEGILYQESEERKKLYSMEKADFFEVKHDEKNFFYENLYLDNRQRINWSEYFSRQILKEKNVIESEIIERKKVENEVLQELKLLSKKYNESYATAFDAFGNVEEYVKNYILLSEKNHPDQIKKREEEEKEKNRLRKSMIEEKLLKILEEIRTNGFYTNVLQKAAEQINEPELSYQKSIFEKLHFNTIDGNKINAKHNLLNIRAIFNYITKKLNVDIFKELEVLIQNEIKQNKTKDDKLYVESLKNVAQKMNKELYQENIFEILQSDISDGTVYKLYCSFDSFSNENLLSEKLIEILRRVDSSSMSYSANLNLNLNYISIELKRKLNEIKKILNNNEESYKQVLNIMQDGFSMINQLICNKDENSYFYNIILGYLKQEFSKNLINNFNAMYNYELKESYSFNRLSLCANILKLYENIRNPNLIKYSIDEINKEFEKIKKHLNLELDEKIENRWVFDTIIKHLNQINDRKLEPKKTWQKKLQ